MNTQINPANCPICNGENPCRPQEPMILHSFPFYPAPAAGQQPKPPRDDSTIWVVVALLVVVAVFIFS